MKKHFVFVALAAVVAAGCAKEQIAPVSFGEGTMTKITVAFQETKLTIGDLKDGKRPMFWTKDDQIAANGVKSDKLVDSLLTDGGACATFMFRDAVGAPLEIIYPASAYKDATSVELTDNPSYNKPKVVLMGKSASLSETATLKAAVALIKTTFTTGDDNDPIRTVEVSSATAQLRGLFIPDYENATLTSTQDAEEFRTITQTINKGIPEDAPLELYTIVPAGTYDVTVKVTNAAGKYMEKTLTGKTFEAGSIYALPATKFEPTGAGEAIEIPDAATWNEFATAFNENPEENMKPVEITGDLDFLGSEVVSLGTDEVGFPLAINGNDHFVSNIQDGSVSLVNYLGATGILKNLTVDESCSFVVALPAADAATLYFAPFVKSLEGTVDNLENKAAIALSPEEEFKNEKAKDVYIGGIASYVATKSTSRILNCRNSGDITIGSTFKDDLSRTISSNRFAVGGIAGYGNASDIRDCSNSGNITCNYPINGYISAGISGGVSGDYYNCTNSGSISKINGDSSKNRNEYLAGINAYSWSEGAKYYDCSNTGNITASGAEKTTYIGGITAYNTKTLDLKRCSNSGDLKAVDQKLSYETTTIGGLLGYIKYAQTIDLSGCSVTGEIALSFNGSATTSDQVAIGGIIGLCGEGVTIEGNGFTITPNIHVTFPAIDKKPYDPDYFGMGAIVGVNREVNSGTKGKVTIRNCKISGGKVQIDNMDKNKDKDGNGIKFRYNNLAVGGLLGISFVGGAEINGCEVDGTTVGISPKGRNPGSNTSEANMAVGGIAGRVLGGVSSISNCKFLNTSSLYSNVYHSVNETLESLNTGGIIGECGDAENAMTISKCTFGLNKGSFNRAMVGGIAGKAINTTITDCSVDLGTTTFADARSSAGIVGIVKDGTVTNCTVLATATKAIYCSYTSAAHEFAGGIAAVANNTAFTNCKSFANVCVNKKPDASNPRNDGAAIGGFVAKALNGSTFTGCSCGGSLFDTAGGIITADTPAGTTITLTDSNVNTYAIQYTDGEAPTFTYWNGE